MQEFVKILKLNTTKKLKAKIAFFGNPLKYLFCTNSITN